MGYCMDQRDANFRIKRSNLKKALEAIKALAGKETIGDASGRHFSWVNTADFLKATTLAAAMDEWRWTLHFESDDGDADGIQFHGEKSGDDMHLFQAIAPFVERGSFIEMQGEDGALWRWVFNGKTCEEKEAKVSWE